MNRIENDVMDSARDTHRQTPRAGAPAWLLVTIGLILAAIAVVLFLQYQQLGEVGETVADFDNRLSKAESDFAFVSEKAGRAEETAMQAAELSRISVRQRDQALDDAQQAQAQADQAHAQATHAAQQAADAEQRAERAETEARTARDAADRIQKERQAEIERLQGALGKIAETRKTALGLVMSLGSDSLRFDFDKAELRPENRELLSRIAGILLTSRSFGIYVYGHTDDIGSESYNQDLSERRAQAVRDYLVDAGLDPGLISTKGFGKSRPRVAGTDAEARAKNRRVEIGIVNTNIRFTAVAPDTDG